MLISLLQIVHVLVAVVLICLILIQSGKGQGLAGAFGSFAGGTAQNLFGARTTDVLTKVTAYVALAFFVSSFFLAYMQLGKGKSVVSGVNKSKAAVAQNVSQVPTQEAQDVSKKIGDLTNKLLGKKGPEVSGPVTVTTKVNDKVVKTETVNLKPGQTLADLTKNPEAVKKTVTETAPASVPSAPSAAPVAEVPAAASSASSAPAQSAPVQANQNNQ